jgi:protoheme IX farnesyltransferase
VIGWASVTGGISVEPLLLFLIVFLWTPPHFWALSLIRADDYARAGVPMLPVVAGLSATRRWMLVYSLVLVPAGAAPWLMGYAGIAYGATALVAGALMIACAWRVLVAGEGERTIAAARQMFGYSILYLFVLFAVLLIEAGLLRAGLLAA